MDKDEPHLEVYRCLFQQVKDCCDSETADGKSQELVVEMQNGGLGAEDAFWVLRSERWSFDSIEEIVTLLRRAGCRESLRLKEGGSPDEINGSLITVTTRTI